MRLCNRHNKLLPGITTRCSRYIITAPISFRDVSRETLPLMLESLHTQQNYILLCSTWNIAFLWSKLCAINRTFPGKVQFNFCQAQERRLSLPHNSDSRFPYCFTWYIYLSILVQEHGYTRINAGLNMPLPMISLQWYLHYFRESISLNLKWEPAQLSLPTGWQLQFQGSVTCSAQTHYSPYHSDFSDESNDSSLLLWIPTVSVYLGYYIAHVRQFLRFVIQSVQTFFCAYPFLSVVLTLPPLLFTDSNHGNLDLNETSTIAFTKTLI